MAQAGVQTKPSGNPHNFIEGTLTNTNDTITLTSLIKHGSVSIQLDGTWSGTVTFECSTNNSTWVTLGLFPVATPAASVATTSTGNGVWGNVMQGYKAIRARFTTASSGNVTCTINAIGAVL